MTSPYLKHEIVKTWPSIWSAADADTALDETIHRMREAAGRIALPDLRDHGSEAAAMAEKMIEIVRTRTDSFT